MENKSIQEKIHSKGFSIIDRREVYGEDPEKFGKIKVGTKTLDDAVLNLGTLKRINRNFTNKHVILKALAENNLPLIREISDYFYRTSGIYYRVCNYFAYLYRYDWYISPEILDDTIGNEKVLKEFHNLLNFLDNSHVKKLCGDIALEVVKSGAYYGYVIDNNESLILQQLPINYCRTRYFIGNSPAIEFNMKFFDDHFRDTIYRMRVLKMFPKEFQKGYALYKQGKLPADYIGEVGCWYLLDPACTVKFSFTNDDLPIFVRAIPSIIDLDDAQDLDRRKQMQQLLKILIQKLPLDKNGDLIFDVDEARDIHNNAVEMLSRAIGVDVLTTFADVKVEDMADTNTSTSVDDLEKVERTVYNEFGVPEVLFNSDSNIATSYSILNDESTVRSLLLQFHIFLDKITQKHTKGNRKKFRFRFYMLETTQYNYTDIAKMYKEQVQIGYSKMLPQIALGHSQSAIINAAYFENNVLNLTEIMIPPLMSSTMSGEDILGKKSEAKAATGESQNEGGRPEKDDKDKSEKTIQNRESL